MNESMDSHSAAGGYNNHRNMMFVSMWYVPLVRVVPVGLETDDWQELMA